jgi:hypothetical protein
MKYRSAAIVVLSFVLAGALPAVMIEIPADQLAARADVIVSGTVTRLDSRWDEAKTLIYTDVRVATGQFEKGTAGREVTVRIPGGEVGDIGLAVEDMPIFKVGDEVKLYLTRTSEAGVYELFGGHQGAIAGGGTQYYSYSGYHRSPATCNYYINSSLPADWVSAIQSGDAAWDAAGSAFRYNYGGTTTRTGPTADGYNIIWRKDLGAGGTIAANYYWYNRTTKIVSENDIIFNSRLAWSTTGSPSAFDVQNIITHELGHCLVLDDIYKTYQKEMTMYGYASAGETKKRTLEFGDKDGIKYVYGAGVYQARPAANE